MKIPNILMKIFKPEDSNINDHPEEKEEKCRHDWEAIKKYPFIFFPLDGEYEKKEIGVDDEIGVNPPWLYNPIRVQDRVCIKCGECHNGFKIMQEHNKAIEKRKEYAKKLWEDGCKNDNK